MNLPDTIREKLYGISCPECREEFDSSIGESCFDCQMNTFAEGLSNVKDPFVLALVNKQVIELKEKYQKFNKDAIHEGTLNSTLIEDIATEVRGLLNKDVAYSVALKEVADNYAVTISEVEDAFVRSYDQSYVEEFEMREEVVISKASLGTLKDWFERYAATLGVMVSQIKQVSRQVLFKRGHVYLPLADNRKAHWVTLSNGLEFIVDFMKGNEGDGEALVSHYRWGANDKFKKIKSKYKNLQDLVDIKSRGNYRAIKMPITNGTKTTLTDGEPGVLNTINKVVRNLS